MDQDQHSWKCIKQPEPDWGKRYIERSSKQVNTSLHIPPWKWFKQLSRNRCSYLWNVLGTGIRLHEDHSRSGLYVNCELDSTKSTPQWQICKQMNKLKALISQTHEYKCIHIFRETNWVADALSKHSHNFTSPQIYYNSQELPKEAKTYY